MVAEEELRVAEGFLKPLLQPAILQGHGPLSLAGALLQSTEAHEQLTPAQASEKVTAQALMHLNSVYMSLASTGVSQQDVEQVLQTSTSRRIIDMLFDLVAVEGIYPYLMPGVGVPIQYRMQSLMSRYNVSIERPTSAQPLGGTIQDTINFLVMHTDSELFLAPNRILVDLLAILFQCCFSPDSKDENNMNKLDTALKRSVQSYVIPLMSIDAARIPLQYLFPNLTALLHADAPKWLKDALSVRLARLPLRDNGIRHTILFLSTAAGQTPAQSQGQASQGPLITPELLQRLAKVVCSVPASITADQWFKNISAQLLSILDDTDVDDQKLASYALGAILSRRQIGSPGTPGWKYIAEPIIDSLSYEYEGIPSLDLDVSLKRLARLVTFHPNPGLIKRIWSRVFRSLWFLACGPSNNGLFGFQDAEQVLRTYFGEAGPQSVMIMLKHIDCRGMPDRDLSWAGKGESWTVVPASKRSSSPDLTALMKKLERISSRVDYLADLVKGFDAEELSTLCVSAIRQWMSDGHGSSDGLVKNEQQNDEPDSHFITAQFVQSFLQKYQQELASSPKQLVPLINDIINQYLHASQSRESNRRIGLENLAQITNGSTQSTPSFESNTEMVEISLGLLTILLLDEQHFSSSIERPVCLRLKDSLESLSVQPKLPTEIAQSADALVIQLRQAVGMEPTSAARGQTASTETTDGAKYRAALEKISAPEPPIRAEGLADLNSLIVKPSSVVPGSATIVLLVSLLKEADEYTHLAAIRSLVVLGTSRPATTIESLTTSFVDADEESKLDVRLKVAESVQQIVAKIGSELPPVTATIALQGAILVGGRRPERPKEAARQVKDAKKQPLDRKVQAIPGLTIPDLDLDDAEDVTPADEIAARLLQKWGGSGRDEDIRVRSSALPIADVIFQHAFSHLQAADVRNAFDVILNILKFELFEEAAILRRSAVLCLQSIVRGANTASPDGNFGAGFGIRLLEEGLVCLDERVRNETDDLTRGHAEIVKSIIEDSQRDALEFKFQGNEIRFDLGGQLRGLDVNPQASNKPNAGIEEVE